MTYTVEYTKCYLVQVRDEFGNEVEYEYVFGDKKKAEERGNLLKRDVESGLAERKYREEVS